MSQEPSTEQTTCKAHDYRPTDDQTPQTTSQQTTSRRPADDQTPQTTSQQTTSQQTTSQQTTSRRPADDQPADGQPTSDEVQMERIRHDNPYRLPYQKGIRTAGASTTIEGPTTLGFLSFPPKVRGGTFFLRAGRRKEQVQAYFPLSPACL
jgi:hypothetical protein